VPERIDIVDVFRRSEFTPAIADAAVNVGAKALWLQSGVTNEDAAARAAAGGLTVVMDACIGVMHSMLQVPRKSLPPSGGRPAEAGRYRTSLRDLFFQLGDERVELIDDCADGFRLSKVH